MNQSSVQTNDQSNPSNKMMILDEARKVLWLRNNPKPLGELLDEGYLNQARLEWAASKAYDPRLKQAAQVLLDAQKLQSSVPPVAKKTKTPPPDRTATPLPIGITLQKARATEWPLRPYKGQPMGMLAETRQISLKDLGIVAENAWDEQVRRAAIALMLVRLNQAVKEPAPSVGFLHVVSSGTSYAERKQYILALTQGLILGAVLMSLLLLTIWSFIRQFSTHANKPLLEVIKSPSVIVALLIVLGLAAFLAWLVPFLINWPIKKLDKEIENYREGQKGEDRVVEIISHNLDGNWSLFRNVSLPGRKRTDLDAVLVGPSGVWVLEIKNFTGEHRNIGEHWEYRAENRWKHAKKSPSRQAQNNAIRLANFLKADGIQQWVIPAVVWANQESPLIVENPTVAVWLIDQLPDELGNVWHRDMVPKDKQNRIVEKLTGLCQEQEKAHKTIVS